MSGMTYREEWHTVSYHDTKAEANILCYNILDKNMGKMTKKFGDRTLSLMFLGIEIEEHVKAFIYTEGVKNERIA